MIRERLRAVRCQQGLSQSQLAIDIGVSTRQLARYESGEGLPSVDVALALSRRLRVSLDWLCGLAQCGECGETYVEEAIERRGNETVRTCEHCRREAGGGASAAA